MAEEAVLKVRAAIAALGDFTCDDPATVVRSYRADPAGTVAYFKETKAEIYRLHDEAIAAVDTLQDPHGVRSIPEHEAAIEQLAVAEGIAFPAFELLRTVMQFGAVEYGLPSRAPVESTPTVASAVAVVMAPRARSSVRPRSRQRRSTRRTVRAGAASGDSDDGGGSEPPAGPQQLALTAVGTAGRLAEIADRLRRSGRVG